MPIFAIVEATNCLTMPEHSTDTYKVAADSAEHHAISEAMKGARAGDVLCRVPDGDGFKFSTAPKGPKMLREVHGSAYVLQ